MITALFSVLLLTSDASAAAQTSASAEPVAAEAPKEEKKICKRDEATESRLGGKRICLTAKQWRERDSGGVKGLGDVSK